MKNYGIIFQKKILESIENTAFYLNFSAGDIAKW